MAFTGDQVGMGTELCWMGVGAGDGERTRVGKIELGVWKGWTQWPEHFRGSVVGLEPGGPEVSVRKRTELEVGSRPDFTGAPGLGSELRFVLALEQ